MGLISQEGELKSGKTRRDEKTEKKGPKTNGMDDKMTKRNETDETNRTN